MTAAQPTSRVALIDCSRIGDSSTSASSRARRTDADGLPCSHATRYEAHPRTQPVAGGDSREDVPPERQCTDCRDLLRTERLDLLGIATQPAQRAAMGPVAEHGVCAGSAEKPRCASVARADAVVAAVAGS